VGGSLCARVRVCVFVRAYPQLDKDAFLDALHFLERWMQENIEEFNAMKQKKLAILDEQMNDRVANKPWYFRMADRVGVCLRGVLPRIMGNVVEVRSSDKDGKSRTRMRARFSARLSARASAGNSNCSRREFTKRSRHQHEIKKHLFSQSSSQAAELDIEVST
jgi:hypothetical protein